jgi:hypothetical protein
MLFNKSKLMIIRWAMTDLWVFCSTVKAILDMTDEVKTHWSVNAALSTASKLMHTINLHIR